MFYCYTPPGRGAGRVKVKHTSGSFSGWGEAVHVPALGRCDHSEFNRLLHAAFSLTPSPGRLQCLGAHLIPEG